MGFFLSSLEDKRTAVEANRPLMSGFRELWGSSREQCALNLLSSVPESVLRAAVSHPVSCACLTLYEACPVYKVVNLLYLKQLYWKECWRKVSMLQLMGGFCLSDEETCPEQPFGNTLYGKKIIHQLKQWVWSVLSSEIPGALDFCSNMSLLDMAVTEVLFYVALQHL